MAEQRQLGDLSPIDAPIMTLSGSSDPFLTEQDAVGWALYTNGRHVHASVDGDHFFITNCANEVVPGNGKKVEAAFYLRDTLGPKPLLNIKSGAVKIVKCTELV